MGFVIFVYVMYPHAIAPYFRNAGKGNVSLCINLINWLINKHNSFGSLKNPALFLIKKNQQIIKSSRKNIWKSHYYMIILRL